MYIRNLAKQLCPSSMRPVAKSLYLTSRSFLNGNHHPAHTGLKKIGTVQDLYYWVSENNLDTLLLLQNYYSVLFPSLDTTTEGTVTVFNPDGVQILKHQFAVPHLGGVKLRISELISSYTDHLESYGTFEVHLQVPPTVLNYVSNQKVLYFWDRFYVGYSTKLGQACFVHGVDKTHIYQYNKHDAVDYYRFPKNLSWAPEIPIDINDYKRLHFIMINRTSTQVNVGLTIRDISGKSVDIESNIVAKGICRFEVTPQTVTGLIPDQMTARIVGMPTDYGRPVLFKEFHNGSISAMHC